MKCCPHTNVNDPHKTMNMNDPHKSSLKPKQWIKIPIINGLSICLHNICHNLRKHLLGTGRLL